MYYVGYHVLCLVGVSNPVTKLSTHLVQLIAELQHNFARDCNYWNRLIFGRQEVLFLSTLVCSNMVNHIVLFFFSAGRVVHYYSNSVAWNTTWDRGLRYFAKIWFWSVESRQSSGKLTLSSSFCAFSACGVYLALSDIIFLLKRNTRSIAFDDIKVHH